MSEAQAVTPGTYYIWSRVENAKGQRLAMTFNGNKQPITVTPLDTSNSKQRWVIQDYKGDSRGLQHVKPKDDQTLEAGWGETIYTLPVGNYVWGITQDNGYVIKDGDKSISWSINDASNGVPVVPIKGSTGEKQRWVFHDANASLP
ncbi:hypothetical protein MD484_g655, partial [Candolleomyces efflorescens]